MAIKKSDLYSSLWASCDELRGGMDHHRGAVNGWWFWSIKDETGNWVKLKDLRK
jgi:hypothetical protein